MPQVCLFIVRCRLALLLLIMVAVGTACGSSSTFLLGPTLVKCAATPSPPAGPIVAAGGLSSLAVTASPECAWTAATEAPWITDLAPASGQGNGQIQFRTMPNLTTSARQADILLNDVPVRVTQQALSCSFTVAPPAQRVGSTGGTVQLVVTTADGCEWSASANDDWLSVDSVATRRGPGEVEVQVPANTGPERSGSVSIAGQSIAITQGAAGTLPSGGCTYTVQPSALRAFAEGGEDRVTVSAPDGCAWTGSSHASWIAVAGATSGVGTGPLRFVVSANSGTARSGSLTVAGQVVTVTQDAAGSPPLPPLPQDCSATLAPASATVPASGGTGPPISVQVASGCAWTATSAAPWIAITTGASGTGNGTVSFQVTANTTSARTGTLLIAGRTFTVSQGSGCAYTVAPTAVERDNSAVTDLTVTVTAGAGCNWTAVSHDSWIEVTGGASGSGNGTVVFSLERNRGQARTGSLTIAGTTVTVRQDR